MAGGDYGRMVEAYGYHEVDEAAYCGLCGSGDATHTRGCPADGRDPQDDLDRWARERAETQQCYECGYTGGQHNEGGCSQWRDQAAADEEYPTCDRSLDCPVHGDSDCDEINPDEHEDRPVSPGMACPGCGEDLRNWGDGSDHHCRGYALPF